MNFRKFFKRQTKNTQKFLYIQSVYFRKDGKLYIEYQVEEAWKGEEIVVRSQYYIIKGEFCYFTTKGMVIDNWKIEKI